MGIRLGEGDMAKVAQIHNAIAKAMSEMPHEFMKSERYGAWAVTALANILCRILKMMNLDKSKAYQLIDDIWDDQGKYRVLN